MQIDLLIKPDSEKLNYTVANHDKLTHYLFNFEKQEVIETKLGSASSLIFKREKKDFEVGCEGPIRFRDAERRNGPIDSR